MNAEMYHQLIAHLCCCRVQIWAKTHFLPQGFYNLMQSYLSFIWFTFSVLLWLMRNPFTPCWERRYIQRFGYSLLPWNELLGHVKFHDPISNTCTKHWLLAHQVSNKYDTDMHTHMYRRTEMALPLQTPTLDISVMFSSAKENLCDSLA